MDRRGVSSFSSFRPSERTTNFFSPFGAMRKTLLGSPRARALLPSSSLCSDSSTYGILHYYSLSQPFCVFPLLLLRPSPSPTRTLLRFPHPQETQVCVCECATLPCRGRKGAWRKLCRERDGGGGGGASQCGETAERGGCKISSFVNTTGGKKDGKKRGEG